MTSGGLLGRGRGSLLGRHNDSEPVCEENNIGAKEVYSKRGDVSTSFFALGW